MFRLMRREGLRVSLVPDVMAATTGAYNGSRGTPLGPRTATQGALRIGHLCQLISRSVCIATWLLHQRGHGAWLSNLTLVFPGVLQWVCVSQCQA